MSFDGRHSSFNSKNIMMTHIIMTRTKGQNINAGRRYRIGFGQWNSPDNSDMGPHSRFSATSGDGASFWKAMTTIDYPMPDPATTFAFTFI